MYPFWPLIANTAGEHQDGDHRCLCSLAREPRSGNKKCKSLSRASSKPPRDSYLGKTPVSQRHRRGDQSTRPMPHSAEVV